MNSQSPYRFARDVALSEFFHIAWHDLGDVAFMQFIIEGTGTIDPQAFAQAVAAATRASPGPGCTYRHRQWVDEGRQPRITYAEPRPFDGYNFNCLELLHRTYDISKEPCAEIFFISTRPLRILIRIFHGVMDGAGAMIWIGNIFKFLRSEPLTEAQSTVTDLQFVQSLTARKELPKTHFKYRVLEQWGPAASHQVHWHRLTIDGAYTGISSRIAAVLAARLADPTSLFIIPVDLRRHRLDVRATANLVNLSFLEASKSEPWQAIYGRLILSLRKKEELNAFAADQRWMMLFPRITTRIILRLMLAYQKLSGCFIWSGCISHLGRVRLMDLSTKDFTATSFISVPVHESSSPIGVQIIEAGQKTEILLASYLDYFTEHACRELLSAINDDLTGLQKAG